MSGMIGEDKMSVSENEDIFTTWISDIQGTDASIVYLCGELDTSSAPSFLADIQEIIGRCRDIIMDVHLLSYVDSTGVAAILSVRNALREFGKNLYLAGCHGLLTKILNTIQASNDIICFEDADQAIEALKSANKTTGS